MSEQLRIMRMAAWDMYASGILSMSLHPGTTRDKQTRMTVEEVANMADAMLMQRDRRFGIFNHKDSNETSIGYRSQWLE